MAITPINTLKNFFKTGLIPTQDQYWAWLDSFRHKSENIPVAQVDGINELLVDKASIAQIVALQSQIVSLTAGTTFVGGVTTASALPSGTDNLSAFVGPGTYPNWGGMVVPDNNFGVLQRIDGVFWVSLLTIPLADYQDIATYRKEIFGDYFIKKGYLKNNNLGYSTNSLYKCTPEIAFTNLDILRIKNTFKGGDSSDVTFLDENKNIVGVYNKLVSLVDVFVTVTPIPETTAYIVVNALLDYDAKITINNNTNINDRIINVEEKIETIEAKLNTDMLTKEDIAYKADVEPIDNLFNKQVGFEDTYKTNTGTIVTPISNFFLSEPIPVVPLTAYKGNTMRFVNYLDVNRNQLAGGSNTNTTTFTTPANAYFAEVTLEGINAKETFMLVQGNTLPTTYKPYRLKLKDVEVITGGITAGNSFGVSGDEVFEAIEDFVKTNESSNIWNDNDFLPNSYMGNNNSVVLTAGNHLLYRGLKIEPLTTYTSVQSVRFTSYMDKNGVFVAGGVTTGKTFTTPANAYILNITYFNTLYNVNSKFTIKKGTNTSASYTPYRELIDKSNVPYNVYPNQIIIAPIQHGLSTIQNNIYLEEIIKRELPDSYIRVVGSSSVFSSFDKLLRLTASVGQNVITCELRDIDTYLLQSKSTNYIVNNLSKTASHKVLLTGDSYSDLGKYIEKMVTTIPNITTLGICKSTINGTTIYREGRSGWKLEDYFTKIINGTSYNSPYLHPIDPYKYYGATGFWKKVFTGTAPAYEIEAWQHLIAVLGINSDGFITSPNVNDVMYDTVSSAYKFWDGTTWTVISEATLDFTFNFAKYLTTWGVEVPDTVTLFFGFNDFWSLKIEEVGSVFYNWDIRVMQFITNVRLSNPNVNLILLTPCSADYTQYQTNNRVVYEFYKLLVETYSNRESERIYISDVRVSVDVRAAIKSTTSLGNENDLTNPININYWNADIHYSNDGMDMIGKKLAATIQHIRP